MTRRGKNPPCCFRAWLEATDPYVASKADPALLTWDEFHTLVNSRGVSHPSSAYDWSLSEMKGKPEEYPTLLFRRTIRGIGFEFRSNKIDRYQHKFVKTDPDGNPVRVNGEVQYHTPDELARLEIRRYEYDFSVFDGPQQVAVSQDEWGALLYVVAREYRGFGLAPILAKLAWEAEPGKGSGGFTPEGRRVARRVHAEFVREYLRKGFYSLLVSQGTLTAERVKEIVASIGPRPAEPSGVSLQSNDPRSFLLYADNGCFILYDRKLKDLIDEGDEEKNYPWYERLIKGTSYAGGGYHTSDRLFLHQLGGDSPQIIQFMLTLALSYCRQEGCPLRVYDGELKYVDPKTTDITSEGLATLKAAPIDYRGMAYQELAFRKSFDRYGEFLTRLLEIAESKYRKYN